VSCFIGRNPIVIWDILLSDFCLVIPQGRMYTNVPDLCIGNFGCNRQRHPGVQTPLRGGGCNDFFPELALAGSQGYLLGLVPVVSSTNR
jgi:hypothetical protein